jgi:hypothetical protein
MATRSLENAVFSITANRIGAETGQGQSFRFTGKSQILTPTGEVLTQAVEDGQACTSLKLTRRARWINVSRLGITFLRTDARINTSAEHFRLKKAALMGNLFLSGK